MTELDPSIFRAYDIRGRVGDTLTEASVHRIGLAFGSEAAERGEAEVVIARDGRLSGPDLAAALAQGLQEAGRQVIDLGPVPTPVAYFATHYLDASSCIVVTGSHNPPEYNGLKLVLSGETLHGDGIQALRRRAEEGVFQQGHGAIRQLDLSKAYLERITGDVRLTRPLAVGVDCGNGVAGLLAPRLLEALGCEVLPLYCDVDGHFPNHHPNPSVPANLSPLITAVRERGLDLGVAFDGDGDRLGVVDGQGRIIWADRQMMLFASEILGRRPGIEVIYDVKCSRQLADVVRAHGGQPRMWKTGHSLIKAKLRETGAALAGEMSGHIFFRDRWYGFDDALYAAARLLEILSQDPRPPSEVFAGLPDSVNTPELNVAFQEEGAHFRFMDRLRASAHFPGAEVNDLDGLRVDYPHGWGLVRPSNTTPSLVIRFEADDEDHLAEIQNAFRRAMQAVDDRLDLPF